MPSPTSLPIAPPRAAARAWAFLVGCVLLVGCGSGGDSGNDGVAQGPGPGQGLVAPDFRLPDVNPNSASAGTQVGPTLRLGFVTAWYFAHAT